MAEFETILTARNEMRAAIDSAIADVERLKRAQSAKIDPASLAGFSPGQIKAITLGARNMGVSFEEQAAKVRGSLGKIKPAANDTANAVRGFGNAGKASLSGMDGYLGSMASRYLSIGAAIGSATMAYKAFATSDAQLRGLAASLGTTVQHTAGLEGQFKKLANSIARPTDEVIGAFDTWRTRSGLAADVAMRSYSKVAAAAAVAGAPIREFGESFGVVVQNLKISEAEIPDAINSFLHARRVYGVEINEMMRSLPKLSQVMSDWGYSGASAAATLATAIAAVKPAFKDSMQAGLGLADLFTTLGGKDFLDVIGLNADEAREQLQALQKQGVDPLVGIMRIAEEVFSRTGGNFNERLFPNKLDPAYLALRRIWEQWSKMPQAFRESAEAKRELDKQLATAIEGSPAQQLQELKNEFWGLVQAFGSLIDKAGVTSGMKKLGLEFLAIAKLIEKMENSRFFKKMFGEEPKSVAATSADTATRGKIPGSELTFVPQTGGEKWTWENFWQHMLQQDRVKGLEAYNDYLDKRKLETVQPEDIGSTTEGALNRPGTPPTQEQIDAKKRTEAEYNSAEERIRRGAELVQGNAKKEQARIDRYYKLNKKDEDTVKNAPVIVAPPLVPQAATEVPPQPAPAPAQSWYQKYLGGFRRPQARPMSAEELPDYRPLLKTSMMPGFGLPVIPSDPKVRNAITGAMIPLNSVRKRISGDAEDPDAPLRSALREMLGLPDPKEPAPWKPGGQWPHPDKVSYNDSTDFSASRRMTPVPEGVLLKRQEEQIKVTGDLVNEIRELNELVKSRGGSLAGDAGINDIGGDPARGGAGAGVSRPGRNTMGGGGPSGGGSLQGAQSSASLQQALGISSGEYDAFRQGVADIESSGGRYDLKGGSSNRFSGAYQFGADEIAETARRLGEPVPSREQFLSDPAMQERYMSSYTLDHHNQLMKNPKYAAMSAREKLSVLGYAHNQGVGGAMNYLNTGQVGQDAFGTTGTRYGSSIGKRLAELDRGGTPGSGLERPETSVGFLTESQGGAGRRGPLNADARAMLSGAGEATGLRVDVTSGTEVPGGFHSGSGRHSGGTADFDLYDKETNEKIPIGSPRHLKFLEEAAKRGAMSGGAAPGYMGNYKTDLGLVGRGQLYRGTPEMQAAFQRGRAQRSAYLAAQRAKRSEDSLAPTARKLEESNGANRLGRSNIGPDTASDIGGKRSLLDDELEKRRKLEEPIKLNWANSVGADGRLGPATQRQASAEALKHADYDLSHDIYT